MPVTGVSNRVQISTRFTIFKSFTLTMRQLVGVTSVNYDILQNNSYNIKHCLVLKVKTNQIKQGPKFKTIY